MMDNDRQSYDNRNDIVIYNKRDDDIVLDLSIGSKANSVFTVDQTPTPTRLIKNCEEVGLFEDLNRVNPFDETFRRAVESKDNPNSTVIPAANASTGDNLSDDSLHTPQVFPICEHNTEPNIFLVEKPTLTLQTNVGNNKIDNIVEEEITSNEGSELQTHTEPLLDDTAIQTQTSDATYSKPQVLKRFILPKYAIENKITKISLRDRVEKFISNTKSVDIVKSKKNITKNSHDEDFKERRRKASMRYREKVQKELVELRERTAALSRENKALKNENSKLKLMLSQTRDISDKPVIVNTFNSNTDLSSPNATHSDLVLKKFVPVTVIPKILHVAVQHIKPVVEK